MKPFAISLVMFLAALTLTPPLSASGWEFRLESGAVFSGYNDVQIPNPGGTLFSLSRDLNIDPRAYFRLRLTRELSERQSLSLLVAPLTLRASGRAPRNITFEGKTFGGGEQLNGTYTFNSYRLTYSYRLHESERFGFALGFTGKIRDAAIRLESAAQTSEKTNVGFVPLVNFSLRYTPAARLNLILEGDALAAPQGRAEDVLLAAEYKLRPGFGVSLGYRVLEGGADVSEVYNFALLHYLTIGLRADF